MSLKDVCRKPSIRILTRPATDTHVSHKATLLTVDWSNVTAEEYQQMAMQWVTTHYQQWAALAAVGMFGRPIPEKDEVSVRWLIDHNKAKETSSDAIPDSWKGKEATPQEKLDKTIAAMTPADIATLLAQLTQLQQSRG